MSNRKLVVNGNKVTVTKDFMKKASIFGTEEYKLWKEVLADIPKAKMVAKKIKRNTR